MKIKKLTSIVLIVVFILVIGSFFGCILSDGYAYYGDVWYDTPQEALAAQSHNPTEDPDTLTILTELGTIYMENAHIMYVSRAKTLVVAVCVANEQGQWSLYGHSEETLEDPRSFLLNGDPEQWILSPYHINKATQTVYGWKLTEAPAVLVNGHATETQTYTFTIDGKDWSIDFWKCTELAFDESTDIQITYTNQ